MKAIILCSLLFSFLTSVIQPLRGEVVDPDYCHENKIDFISMEPLKNGDMISNITIKYSFEKEPTYYSFLNVTITNSIYPRGRTFFYSRSRQKEVTTIIQYDQKYSNLSIQSSFTFSLTGEGSDEVTLEAKVYTPEVMKVDEENKTYESNESISIYRRGVGTSYYKEKFVFTNMVQEINMDCASGINFSGVMFNYVAPDSFPLNYENARLVIEAPEGTFEHFGTKLAVANWRKLETTITKNENTGQYSIHPLNDCYVNPYTLDMSSEHIDGYIKTKYLYFPRPRSEVDTYVIRFMVEDMGANDNDFVYQFNVYVSRNLLGNCSDSCFCLSTEDTYPDLETGTIINH